MGGEGAAVQQGEEWVLEGNGEGFVRMNLSSQCSERKQGEHGVPVMLRSRD